MPKFNLTAFFNRNKDKKQESIEDLKQQIKIYEEKLKDIEENIMDYVSTITTTESTTDTEPKDSIHNYK